MLPSSFAAWMMGEVTDNLIGRRFGYGVLGRFYGTRDWQQGTFDSCLGEDGGDEENQGAVAAGDGAMPGPGASEPNTGTDVQGQGGSVASAEPASGALTEPGAMTGADAAADVGAVGPSSMSARPASSTERAAVSGDVRARQTSLAHWLL